MVAIALAGAALTYGVVTAAILPTTGDVTAGARTVAKCDPNGFTIDALATNVSGQVTSITIGDIHSNCVNGTLKVDLTTSANVSVGTGGPVLVTGPSMTVTIPGLPNASLVKHEVIIIVGP